jgi:hypothetical protein
MNQFITIDYMGSFAGMVAIILLLTQFSKDLVDKAAPWLPTKYVAFIYALVVIFGYQFMSGTFNISQIILTLVNAVILTMTAQGSYEWLYKPVELKAAASIPIVSTVTTSNLTEPKAEYSKLVAENPINNPDANTTNQSSIDNATQSVAQ